MYLVGLTGGIGSGKSTVAHRLREHGCEVIDADAIAREIVAPGEPALFALVDRFGGTVLHEDGTLDRRELARIAFADEESRGDLDRITHPRIAARIAERIAELGAAVAAAAGELIVVDHPLLVETGQAGRFDAVVIVSADEERRVQRLIDGRGMQEPDIRARLRSQASDDERRAAATHVLENDGSMEELLQQVDRIHAELTVAAGGEATIPASRPAPTSDAAGV